MQNLYSVPETVLKNGIILSFRPIIAFFGHFGPILDQFWPNFDPKLNLESKNLQFLCKIHTQWLKPCEKMVLFFSLGLLVHFGPFWVYFGPNLTQNSQIGIWKPKFTIFMQNSYSVPETEWKKDLVWLSRPLISCLVIWSNFGTLRANISKWAWETYPQNFSLSFTHA